MAGDHFNIRVSSWYYKNGTNPGSPNSIASDLASSLINSLTGTGGPVHGTISSTQLTSSGVMSTTVNDFLNTQPAAGSVKPKAYLNWVLLDEQFKFVQNGSSAEQVGDDQEFKTFTKTNLPVTKNGYLYVYVSNETPNIDVFFDNLQVTHIHGPLVEETHYYPFGLTMAGISDKAAGGLENKKRYNGIEFDNDLDLNEYEADLRDLDPQTGRWWQIDPETEDQEMWSTYTSNNDNPILYSDPRGNEGEACCGGIVQLGEGVIDIYRAVRGGENILDAIKNTGITWKGVINGIGKAIEFDQGGLIKVDPKDLPINKDSKEKESTQPPGTITLTLPPDTKVNGVIYQVPGTHTKTGKPYVGRTKHSDPAKRRSDGGRDRRKAKVVDTYDPNNTQEGREKEQQKIDEHGLDNLDNKRNEIKPPKKNLPKPPNSNKPNQS